MAEDRRVLEEDEGARTFFFQRNLVLAFQAEDRVHVVTWVNRIRGGNLNVSLSFCAAAVCECAI